MLFPRHHLTEPILEAAERTYEQRRLGRQPNACAALVYRFNDGELEILMVTALGAERWILPECAPAIGEASWEAAARAAHAQAGVTGTVFHARIGVCRTSSATVERGVAIYALRLRSTADWPEIALRRRIWMPATMAAAHARDREISSIIRGMVAYLHAPAGQRVPPVVETARADPIVPTRTPSAARHRDYAIEGH